EERLERHDERPHRRVGERGERRLGGWQRWHHPGAQSVMRPAPGRTMSRAVLAFAAASAMLGCKADRVYFVGSSGAIEVDIAAEQSDLCHKDCSTEALQVSPVMEIFIGHLGDGGFPDGPVGPGVYQGPPAPDGGTGVVGWSLAGACDQVPPLPIAVSG